MGICNKQLQAEDKPYPRTCAKCGIGKCQEEQRHENASLKAIAGLIQKLSYRDMMAFGKVVAEQLAKNDGNQPDDMAEVMLDVADEILPREPVSSPSRLRREGRDAYYRGGNPAAHNPYKATGFGAWKGEDWLAGWDEGERHDQIAQQREIEAETEERPKSRNSPASTTSPNSGA